MKVNRDKLEQLKKIYCLGNCSRFARELGMSTSHLHYFLSTGEGGGKKLVGAVASFCRRKGLNMEDYLEF
ncbi:MAG: hypothetical protein N3B21_15835 [Clostridia bacterium]|nr:hypothetical protein [Clostridia bacterium]